MTTQVSIFIARYSQSGVPLAQIRLAKALQRRNYRVEFIIGYVPAELPVPRIEGVRVINLNKSRVYQLAYPIFKYLRLQKPDVIFSAEDHLNVVVTLATLISGSRAKLSTSSRVTPYDTYSNKFLSKNWILKKLSKPLWARVDSLLCVSKDMVKQYEAIFGVTRHQCIYNVVCDSEMYEKMVLPVDEPWLNDPEIAVIISAGRLAPEKGFADLIRAMKILSCHREAKLVILGDGPLRPELEELIEAEGLSGSVKLLGHKINPYKYFHKADVFVLSSYVEGLPNVLVEAMACGCTPVSTDCPTGPREVLKNGEYGQLVPVHSPEELATAIAQALQSPISTEMISRATEPFTDDQVVARHQATLCF